MKTLKRGGGKAHRILASNATTSWILASQHPKVITLLVLNAIFSAVPNTQRHITTHVKHMIGVVSPHSNSNLLCSQPAALKLTMGPTKGNK